MDTTSRRLRTLTQHFSTTISQEKCLNNNFDVKLKEMAKNKQNGVSEPAYVLFGWEIIPEGQAAAIWDLYGSMQLIEGPNSIFLWRQSVQRNLPRHIASPTEYLVVQYKNGRKENVPGPVSMFFNPSKHDAIYREEAITVETGMAIIVYEKNGIDIKRSIIKGPARHLLTSNQWLHRFFWNIPAQENPTISNKKLTELKKVRTIPDQIYFNVENVRTLDDALLIVNLMIFFCLKDIDLMFETTHDPVSEMINSITADVIDFASQRSFEEFKKDSEKLNSTEIYTNLINKAKSMGYVVNKVVFRGYNTNKTLQDMHNSAIETRTALKLKSETEEQSQKNEDFKLEKESSRREKQRLMMQQQEEFEQNLSKSRHTNMLESQRGEFHEKMRQKLEEIKMQEEVSKRDFESAKKMLQMKNQLEMEMQKAGFDMKNQYYARLHQEVNVDVAKVMISEYRGNDKNINVNSHQENIKLHIHE